MISDFERQERQWAMLAHLSALLGFVFPLGNVIGPLVVWLVKRDQFPLVRDQGREALNFQITISMYMVVAFILVFALVGFALMPAVAIFSLVMTIIAAVRANAGERYRYPLTLRLVS